MVHYMVGFVSSTSFFSHLFFFKNKTYFGSHHRSFLVMSFFIMTSSESLSIDFPWGCNVDISVKFSVNDNIWKIVPSLRKCRTLTPQISVKLSEVHHVFTKKTTCLWPSADCTVKRLKLQWTGASQTSSWFLAWCCSVKDALAASVYQIYRCKNSNRKTNGQIQHVV